MALCTSKPKVVVATNIYPKIVGGRLFVNAMSVTLFYLDSETAAGQSYYEKYVRSSKLFHDFAVSN
ncbi:unnamed protein product [Brassica oleracea]|uniref:(rape) hypothetical protein n=1 Tax=Brassica napus TaxID=3708 RepID=A0A816UC45_BRANA|nr:unnamed protein product [Brassica napus]